MILLNWSDLGRPAKKIMLNRRVGQFQTFSYFRDLDAFIYDATVLEYLVAQDEECKLLTVGAWAAMTGYGAAFPRNSKHFQNFNRKIMDFSENGKFRVTRGRFNRFSLVTAAS